MTDLQVVVGELNRFTERAMIALTLEATANLKRAPSEGGTPVDTGWARNNWIPEIGSSSSRPVGDPSNPSAAAGAQRQGETAVLGYTLPMGAIFITNNVPYIGRLNDGHSAQAPAGYVQNAIFEAVQRVEALLR